MGQRRSKQEIAAHLRQWYDDIAFWRHLSLWIRRRLQENPWSLFKTSFWALAGLAVFATLLLLVLAWILGSTWFGNLQIGPDLTRYTVLRMVLFIGAGVVGVIGVIVAYRRQQGAEEGQFLEHLAASARQLGDENPTVQAAGIYALAGLADRSPRARRQQCVDVLCAYLRLPYAPAEQDDEPGVTTSIKRKRTVTTEAGSEEDERTVNVRPHDREIRQTIIRVITQHMKPDTTGVTWSNLDLDFTGAVFDSGDFSGAHFAGGSISFRATKFSDGFVDFENATFSGGFVDFWGAKFSGGGVSFRDTSFSGSVRFEHANFSGGFVDFENATFSGGFVSFENAKFSDDGIVSFRHATFSGGTVGFESATFSGDGYVVFRAAAFSGGTVTFRAAAFSGGFVIFQEAAFSGGFVIFQEAAFSGGVADFIRPRNWSCPPVTPWSDGDNTPDGVSPNHWPPELFVPSS